MLKFTLLIIAFILMHNLGFAQTVVRQSVGTIGKTGNADGVTVVHSTGQPYQTAGTAGFQPGFIQSNNLVFEKIASTIESEMELYPNPVDQELHIKTSQSLTDVSIKVLNMQGILIYETSFPSMDKHTIKCGNWKAGIYFVIVSGKEGELESKVIKK